MWRWRGALWANPWAARYEEGRRVTLASLEGKSLEELEEAVKYLDI